MTKGKTVETLLVFVEFVGLKQGDPQIILTERSYTYEKSIFLIIFPYESTIWI
jgi:hypothetical protein